VLQNIKDLYGSRLSTLDGDIGHARDFYFDDKTWTIRYLAADTGSWLPGRQVLIAPNAFGKLDRYQNTLHLKLQKRQIENSPSIELHKPVSRQFEVEYHRHYGFPAYWEGATPGVGGFPVETPRFAGKKEPRNPLNGTRLLNTRAISGYHIQTAEGTIGHVSGFLIDDRNWAIRQLIVEMGHWYWGLAILISTGSVERFSYPESKVFVNLTKAEILGTTEYAQAKVSAGTGAIRSVTD
jgi:hypothetical protein